jgi:hypothetical protein
MVLPKVVAANTLLVMSVVRSTAAPYYNMVSNGQGWTKTILLLEEQVNSSRILSK